MATVVLDAGALVIELSAEDSALSLSSPIWPSLHLGGLAPALVVDGSEHAGSAACLIDGDPSAPTIEWRFADAPLRLQQTFRPGSRPGEAHVVSELHHDGTAVLVLNRVALLRASGGVALGSEPHAVRLLREGGYEADVKSVAELLADAGARHGADEAAFLSVADGMPREPRRAGVRSQTASVAYSPGERRALLAGFDSFERWLGTVEYGLDGQSGVSSWQLGFDGGDTEIAPGEVVPLESMVFAVGEDPYTTWERYIDLVVERNGLRSLQTPPVSWCSWYPFRLGVSEEKVLAGADIGAARLRSLGLNVIEVDLGWEKDYLPSAYEENSQFPRGLAGLAEELRRRGFRLGAWKAPYTISEFDPVARDHPEWLLQGPDGKPRPQGQWFWVPHGETYSLDLTHPGARQYLREGIRSLAERGARYIKTDFIGMASAANARGRHDRRMVAGGGIEAARQGSRIIAEEMQRQDPDALLLNCNPYEPAGFGTYNLLYTCIDTGNTGFVGWSHLRDCYTTTAVHLAKNRRLGIIQPSCLVVGLPGTLEEARLRATATFLSGGQVDISDDLTCLPEDRWEVLLATLPTTGLTARPVDLFEPVPVRSLAYEGLCRGESGALGGGATKVGPRVWHLPVSHEGDEWHLLALFEYDEPLGKEPLITWFQVPLERLGLDAGSRYWAYEFWSRQYAGAVPRPSLPADAYRHPGDAAPMVLAGKEGNLEVAFFGPAVKLLVLRPAKSHPWPVGTSFHQSGGMELTGVAWDAASRTLRGILSRPPGEHGSITVAGALKGTPDLLVDEQPSPVRPGANGSVVFDVVTRHESTTWQLRWQ